MNQHTQPIRKIFESLDLEVPKIETITHDDKSLGATAASDVLQVNTYNKGGDVHCFMFVTAHGLTDYQMHGTLDDIMHYVRSVDLHELLEDLDDVDLVEFDEDLM